LKLHTLRKKKKKDDAQPTPDTDPHGKTCAKGQNQQDPGSEKGDTHIIKHSIVAPGLYLGELLQLGKEKSTGVAWVITGTTKKLASEE